MNKKQLYESIMREVSKNVKASLNEGLFDKFTNKNSQTNQNIQPATGPKPSTKQQLIDCIKKYWANNQYDEIGNINTSMINDMSDLFEAALGEDRKRFNVDLSRWDVSNVTNMKAMFNECESFNQNIDNWNVSHVTNMSYMFRLCKSFNQPLNDWNVSNVKNAEYMFTACSNFNQPLNKWNVSNIEIIDAMFYECNNFNQSLTSWKNPVFSEWREVEYGQSSCLLGISNGSHSNQSKMEIKNFPSDTVKFIAKTVKDAIAENAAYKALTNCKTIGDLQNTYDKIEKQLKGNKASNESLFFRNSNNALYESIMKNVSKSVGKMLNEMAEVYDNEAEVGDTIKIIYMDDANGKDKSAARMNGKIGVIEHIDDMGQLHGTWGSLAVIPEIDVFEIIEKA